MAIGTIGALALGSAVGGVASAVGSSKAAKAQTQAADQANQTQRYIFDRNVELTEPWRQGGENALAALMGAAGIGEAPSFNKRGKMLGFYPEKLKDGRFQIRNGSGTGKIFDTRGEARDYLDDRRATFEADPGYQFRLDQGTQAMERSAAARGLRLSGGALKGIGDYASGLASQEYGNYFNRLAGLAGVGQAATGQQAAFGQNFANNVSQNALAAGNARASGYIGQANALNNTLGGIGSTIGAAQGGMFGPNPGFGITPSAAGLKAWGY